MKRWIMLACSVASYLMFLGVFVYAAGFVCGVGVPRGIDGPVSAPVAEAVLVNGLLLLAFALQHSVMARPAFKRWLTRIVPAPIERSTYVLCSNLALALIFWQWRPIGGTVWDVQQPFARATIWGFCALGWLTVLVTTFLINHFDLFGLRQAWLHFRGQPYSHLPFKIPGPYRFVRHPLYVGWLMAFWFAPTMTVAHLLFAVGMTAYILAAIPFEERDLLGSHERYAEYRRATPMLIPRLSLAIRQPGMAPDSPPVENALVGESRSRLA